jgi:hypothetical protein
MSYVNKERQKKTAAIWLKKNIERVNLYAKLRQRRQKYRVFSHYGLKCRCCGEDNYLFLSIDHISSWLHDPNHVKPSKLSSKWDRYIEQGYPKNLQTLCYNCNLAKGYWGQCPHRIKSKKLLQEMINPPFLGKPRARKD